MSGSGIIFRIFFIIFTALKRRMMELKRNAVVVIHGIGDPRPMDTLRNFVAAVQNCLGKQDVAELRSVIRSKPDKMDRGFETRMLRLSRSRKRAATDFYEFYWAHHMKDNKFSDFSAWIYKLLRTSGKKVPANLKSIWVMLWVMIVISVLIVAAILCMKPFQAFYSWLASFSAVALIASAVLWFLKRVFLNLAGDAGRYFTPSACNLESRFEIRRKGIELLKSLHACGRYDRIILVGHSLGSVIGYDLLRLLWCEVHDTFGKTERIRQGALKQVNRYTKEAADADFKPSEKFAAKFQEAQHACFHEYRSMGLNWLISDFITIGSPLCNMDFLSGSKIPFQTLVKDREYPCCPPLNDEPGEAVYYLKHEMLFPGSWSFKTLHHAGLFAVTRWTNVFFTNDFIGGRVSRLFGPGVKDIEIKKPVSRLLLGGHTMYWTDKEDEKAIRQICRALNLKEEPA